MDQVQASQAINRRWIEKWPTLSGSIPYALDNITKPDGISFAQLSIVSGPSQQWTMGPEGTRKWQRTGFIEVRLSGPINVGRRPLDELAKVVRNIFEGFRFGKKAGEHGVVTHDSSVSELRRDKQSPQLWILTVTTPFEFYEVR
jgi:hypothetical protein